MKFKFWIPFLVLILIINPSYSQSKFRKTAACLDAQFDKKVDGYLSYSAPVISVTEAFAQQNKYLFLDAREVSEFQTSHLPGAKHIGYDKFDIKKTKDFTKNQPIIVYCSIGYRSEKIATKLRNAGFTNVYNLYGSIFEWSNNGYPLHDSKGVTTTKIHTYNKSWSRWALNPKVVKVY